MRAAERLLRLRRDNDGAVIVEFALIGPVFLAMLLGVVQVGMGMQSYNAIRNVASDVSRDVMIEYLTNNKLSANQIKQTALATSVSAPYLLDGESLEVEVTEPDTQRIDGAKEFAFTIRYDIPSVLSFMGFEAPTIEHKRPIFVIKEDAGGGSSEGEGEAEE
ncbi:TadE-like protein [Altererythrobacter xiamenensis]|uniref:TadE-like protein n=2 Tax=Altererythrobacter xiamenensis TaxID=1316679 RepID=A0A1Y6FPY8_9SPHN|nr:TadE-like protein [Altererythrobacter xiamenensis]